MIGKAIAAFLISILSGMGVGGGGLFVIYLALFTELPQLTVQGMNLLFFLFSAGASMTVHLRSRNIFWGIVGLMAASGLLGAFLGSYCSARINQSILRKIFGGMLVVSGILSLQKQAFRGKEKKAQKGSKHFFRKF